MAAASLLPEKLPNEAAMAAGTPVGTAKAPTSQPQASFAGALHMTGVTPAPPPVNWCLPLPAAGGTTCPAPPLPSSVSGAAVGEGAMVALPQRNWTLSPSIGVGPTAAQAQKNQEEVPSAGDAAATPPAAPTTRPAPALPSPGSAAPVGQGAMVPLPQQNWTLSPSIGVGPTAAAPAQGGAVPSAGDATPPAAPTTRPALALPSAGSAALVGQSAMVPLPQQHWTLSPSIGVGPTAALPAQGGAVPSAGDATPPAAPTTRPAPAPPSPGSGAPNGEGAMVPLPQQNWTLSPSIGVGPFVAVPSAGPATTVTPLMGQPQNSSTAAPGIRAAPGSTETKWSLPSKIRQVAKLQPQDGCISRFDSPSLPPGICTPMVVFLGPLFPKDQRQRMDETKGTYVHNLILRAHRKEDFEHKLKEYLTRMESREPEIRQHYDPTECRVTRKELVEMMVLDGLFVIEVLVNHWMGKIEKGSASPRVSASAPAPEKITEGGQRTGTGSSEVTTRLPPLASTLVPQALKEEFTPLKVSWEPQALRFDLIVVPNQIPFFVLEELFEMTEIPELRQFITTTSNKSTKLREIILDYLVGDITCGAALVGYDGPVYHILHLVYLYLTFTKDKDKDKEGTSSGVSPLQQEARVMELGWRSSLVGRTLEKLKRMRMDLRAFCKRTFSRSSDLPVGWKQWKVIPPLRELVRVGVKLKRVETFRFADVRFRDGKLEIPAFAWRRYHIRLLTNLVVLEMSGWWPREKRLFCSYVMFMSELVMKKEDAALLFKKGIVQENNVGDVEKSLICPILILADFSHGSRYECRFAGIVADMVKCYQRWSKVGVAPTITQL